MRGEELIFKPSNQGLYYFDLNGEEQFSMVQMVQENKFPCSKRELQREKLARGVCHNIGNPSMNDYKAIIRTNSLRNFPVTQWDIEIAEKIFGPDVSALKGKSTKKKPNMVVEDYVKVEELLKREHEVIHLCIDVMYIQLAMFFVTMSKHLKYITVSHVTKHKSIG